MTQKFSNAARAELAATINDTDTTITIVDGGSLFPVANTGAVAIDDSLDWFKLTIQDLDNYEIVYVRTHTTGSTTFSNVLRGQEGTTAHSFLSGSVVGLRPTAGDAESVLTALGTKQDNLVSGTNIKTVGGQNIVGSGDAPIVAPELHAAASKPTPVDDDELGLSDSAASWGLKKLTFANLKAWIAGFFVSRSAAEIEGSLNFSGSGLRITGDFSNATIANQLAAQTNVVNSNTRFSVLPNGTGNVARLTAVNNSDPTNSSEVSLIITSTAARIESSFRGSGTYLPLETTVGGVKNTEQPVAGGFLVTTPSGIGYGVGAGGVVTQATSKSTSVTLNKPTGKITMHNASLAAGATALFTFNNSAIGEKDLLLPALDATGIASTSNYNVWSSNGSGAAVIAVKNISGDALSESVGLRFVVIKGSQS